MSARPWMPLYVRDYLVDTATLSLEEHGAYVLLLMYQWHTGPLVDDEKSMAKLLRITPRRWREIRPKLADFFEISDGKWAQKRLENEREKALDISSKRASSGREGGKAKSLKSQDTSLANATNLPADCQEVATTNGEANPSCAHARSQPQPQSQDSRSSLRSDSSPAGSADAGPTVEPTGDPTAMVITGAEPIGGLFGGEPPDLSDGKPIDTLSPPAARRADEVDEAFRAYNAVAERVGLPVAQKLTEPRERALRARLKDCGGLAGWRVAMEKLEASPFCTGQNAQGWRADLDFVLQAKSFTRLMEGAYDARAPSGPGSGGWLAAGQRVAAHFQEIEQRQGQAAPGSAADDFDQEVPF